MIITQLRYKQIINLNINDLLTCLDIDSINN